MNRTFDRILIFIYIVIDDEVQIALPAMYVAKIQPRIANNETS